MRFSYALLASISVVLTICNAAPVELDARTGSLEAARRSWDSLSTLVDSRDIEDVSVYGRMLAKRTPKVLKAGPVCTVKKTNGAKRLSRRALPALEKVAPALGPRLGGGAFGDVYECATNPNEVVIKKPGAALRYIVEPEVERLQHIGQLKGWAEAGGSFYIKMTRIHGKHLSEFPLYTGATGETKKKVLNAIHTKLFERVMHYKNDFELLHTDMKEENFLIQGTSIETITVELVDWGIADNLKTCAASKTDQEIKQTIAMIV